MKDKKTKVSAKTPVPAERLDQSLRTAEEKLAKLRVDLGAGKLKNISSLKKARGEVARIKTKIRARELQK